VDIIHPEIEVAGGDVPDRVFTRATLVHVLSTVLSVSGSVAVALGVTAAQFFQAVGGSSAFEVVANESVKIVFSFLGHVWGASST